MKLEDYKVLKMLGRGGFGKVLRCQNSSTKEFYAMKILSKRSLVEMNQVEHTRAEQEILAHVNHPFLVSLEAAYMDSRNLYFVMKLMKGGELYTHLGRKKRFDEKTTKFFAACIVLAVSYLHANHYEYRDLKLENILMDEKGYLKLTDFGLSKYMKDMDKTHTMCGTLYYLSPEVISGEGHSYPVDWWSLGVIVFELLNGVPPFYVGSKSDRALMRIIKNGRFFFNEKVKISKEGKDFITKVQSKIHE